MKMLAPGGLGTPETSRTEEGVRLRSRLLQANRKPTAPLPFAIV
jgi:hypothetical protein